MAPTNTPILTLAIPTRNSESRGALSRLEEVSHSVEKLNGAVQLVVIDDASTDQSFNFLSSLDSRHFFTKVLQARRRLGPGGARNLGLEQSITPVVAFGDDDDIVDIDRLAHVAMLAHASSVDVMASPYRVSVHDPERRQLASRTIAPGASLSLAQLLSPSPAVWRFTFSRQFLHENNLRFPPLDYAEDLLFLLDVARCAPRVMVGNDLYYEHCMAANSLSGDLPRLGSQPVEVERRLSQLVASTRADSEIRRSAMEWAARIAGRTLLHGSITQRLGMATYCLRDPRLVQHLVRYLSSTKKRNRQTGVLYDRG